MGQTSVKYQLKKTTCFSKHIKWSKLRNKLRKVWWHSCRIDRRRSPWAGRNIWRMWYGYVIKFYVTEYFRKIIFASYKFKNWLHLIVKIYPEETAVKRQKSVHSWKKFTMEDYDSFQNTPSKWPVHYINFCNSKLFFCFPLRD